MPTTRVPTPILEWVWDPDTPIRVLDPKMKLAGKERGVKEGRVWVYVRDDRPWAGQDPPAAAYWFSPDRKGEHPQEHLKNFIGILQADAYAGFRKLYERGVDGEPRIREAASPPRPAGRVHSMDRIDRLLTIDGRI